MKTFSVSLDVTSAKLPLMELTSRIGMAPSPDAHDIGWPRGRGRTWAEAVWRLSSQAPESAPLEVHLEDVLSRARTAGVLTYACGISEAQVDLNIGVFFDTANCTISIPPAFVEIIKGYPIGLEITCYPSQMEELED